MSRSPESPFDRSRAPRRGSVPRVSFPTFERQRLDCGVTFYSAPSQRTPLVAVQALLPAGAQADPPHRPGLAAFTADLMEEGTQAKSSKEIADAVESLGGYLASGAGWNSASVAISLLQAHIERGLSLLAEVATQPTFEPDEVERLRRERLADILRRRDQPPALAHAALLSTLYGDDPYGHLLIGGEASLQAVDRTEIVDFHLEHRAATATTVIAVGDLPPDRLEPILGEAFGDLPPGKPAPCPEFRPRRLSGRVIVVVDRPKAAQTELRVGHVSVPRNHPDRSILTVLNSLLGGKFTSRINLNLRERHGYTYGASTSFAHRLGPGPFVVSTAVANRVAGAAVGEILSELSRLRDEAVSRAELEETIGYLCGIFPYGLQTNNGVLQSLSLLAVYDLPMDYFDVYLEELRSVTVAQIQRAARDHLFPERLGIVAVGPAAALQSQLQRFGDLKVIEASSLFA